MNSFIKNTQITSPYLIHLQFFFFLLISITSHFPLASYGCQEHERRALLDMKSSLSDPSNRLSSWQQGIQHENCCRWHGIRCSLDTSHIISIDLRNRELDHYYYNDHLGRTRPNTALHGKLSPSLSNITHLKYLDLSFNDFEESQIPLQQLSHLTKLTHLDISYSNFSESISTQFTNLTSLSYLDLSCTEYLYYTSCLKISSSKWLRGLENLKVLKLRGIDLSTSQKSFAQHISYLFDLRYLDISSCSISTWVFDFHNLSRLSTLQMSRNRNLSSEIPVQMANFTSLSILDLSDCGLQGSVPSFTQLKELDVSGNHDLRPDLTRMFQHQWPKLQTLTIDNTNVSGSIPVQMANLTSLSILELSDCGLQGSVPSFTQLTELDVGNNQNLRPDLTRMFQHQWPKLQTLWIDSTNVRGPIPDTISNAPSLVSLSAGGCSIQGSIPSSIGKLSRLQYLVLYANKIAGTIPKSICEMSSLRELDLSDNKISGTIPKSICEMSSLQQLNLFNNKISGTIPSCLTKLHNLTRFDVHGNSIGGSISLINFINELNLRTLDLRSNRLTVVIDQRFHLYSKFQLEYLLLPSCNLRGAFPTFICKMSNLTDLDLSQNQLAGVIPFNCFSKLQISDSLNLSNNKLHGPLPLPPQTYFSTSSLFDVSNNKFSGEISTEIGKRLATFNSLNLAGNELSGQIPFSICSKESQYSRYAMIDLSNNKLSGIIPTSIGYCTGLISLNLGNNNLTGNVPNELQQMIGMTFLQLNDNNLHGTPLDFISKLQYLRVVNLANNHFGGSIPSIFCSLQNLQILSLRLNNFSGSIPEKIVQLKYLQILDLSDNNLSGFIPRKIGNFVMLRSRSKDDIPFVGKYEVYDVQLQMVIKGIMIQFEKLYYYSSGIDLSCNILEGNIPEEIGQLKGLYTLNLSHNHFSGMIPKTIGSMSGLESLDLSFNKLSGNIPQSLASMNSLSSLNLSYNNLSGRIPSSPHFDTLSVDGSAYANNSLLCGFYMNNTCEDDQRTNAIDTDSPSEGYEEDAGDKLLLYAIVALGFGVGFWGLFIVLLLKKEKWWFGYWRLVDIVALRVANCLLKS